ncbi:MAG: L-seryl-tRNA(Sec) selenium transferase [Defluviitaleaceae bacterium]|nr:L-seryl-tRNA(Sec) selenium transferase [Defluviitaleaceae bacterium]MCL2837326.1 L-seryl-tRNA(Sec) selenium transferase [Defluviitaleaceae bacterium]
MADNQIYRNLPKIDDILRDERVAAFKNKLPDPIILDIVRESVADLREKLSKSKTDLSRNDLYEKTVISAVKGLEELYGSRMKRVINATGVLIHTNLGRAPMPGAAVDGLVEMLEGYTNLEYDVSSGTRRSRGYYAERLICGLTGAEDAVCVNNNAAALLLVLNTLCSGREVLLSRGEVVEIGGSFRLSGIIEASGARLREVGSTNRTRAGDYEDGLSLETGAILKAHTSNFKLVGFTESVPAAKLVEIGGNRSIPVIEDMGSGVLTDLTQFGLPYERQAADAVSDGVDIITFSGDKLLGGPQAGIIAGRKDIIGLVRKNPLMRCVRLDKAALWMLEGCLSAYCAAGIPDIPVLRNAAAETRVKAGKLLKKLKKIEGPYSFELVECAAELGGGTLPGTEIKSHGVSVQSNRFTASELEKRLRTADVPVICRVNMDKVIINVIAVNERDFDRITDALVLGDD